jgi:hypothetical protein
MSAIHAIDQVAVFRRRNLPNRLRGWKAEILPYVARKIGFMTAYATLEVKVIRVNGAVEDYGIVSRRMITNNGVAFIVDAHLGTTEMENLNFHGMGTSSTAEAQADAALGAEVETRGVRPDYAGDR